MSRIEYDITVYAAWAGRVKAQRARLVPRSIPNAYGWQTTNISESAIVLLGYPEWPGNDEIMTPRARWKRARQDERRAANEQWRRTVTKGEIGTIYGCGIYRSSNLKG